MKRFFLTLLVFLSLIFSSSGFASMGSTNFIIPTAVISGGGGAMESSNFKSNSTLGQPSVIAMADSAGFHISSGFWYTVLDPALIWDFEPDGDVDGVDLDLFIDGYTGDSGPGYNETDLESFRQEFGISQ